jgi:nicotinamidase-related amidase
MKNTALLLVDLQNDYFDGGRYPLSGSETGVRNAARVLSACRQAGIPVIHVRHISVHPGAGFFLKDTPGAGFHPLVLPADGEPVITKHLVSSYKLTGLGRELKSRGIDTVIVGGMQTNLCAASLTRESVKKGFRTLLVEDALAAVSSEIHSQTLEHLKAVAHETLTAEQVVSKIQGD